ncbi:hypothetical protein RUA4292_01005 [Ruegeria atlantica]|uniref:Uncharacterized protein n=1 Tax=Ruegeria atlantica TaxID=81569 RepID=A0A0P1EBH5_9RHOB|nr:hypothetical protein RUA4292_01005 [Ruegeria atlantica]
MIAKPYRCKLSLAECAFHCHLHRLQQVGKQRLLAEAVLTNPGSEISCIQTEAYERIDW